MVPLPLFSEFRWHAGFLYRGYEKERHLVSISYAEISTLPLRVALVVYARESSNREPSDLFADVRTRTLKDAFAQLLQTFQHDHAMLGRDFSELSFCLRAGDAAGACAVASRIKES